MDKLIAVGMRHIPGAQSYIKANIRDEEQSVRLTPTLNKEATGEIAYVVVEHRDTKIAYIRETDLSQLKHFLHDGSNARVPFKTSDDYVISRIFENYLVLKRRLVPLVNEITNIREHPDKQKERKVKNLNNTKEETMFDKIVTNNKAVAVNAAYMEAGRIANNQVSKLVAAKAPLMVRGYVDTPIGKVVLANLTAMAVEQFRPTDMKLKKVSVAMMTQAYQELIQTLDIEGMLNELTSSEGIKTALAVISGNEEPLLTKA